MRYAFTEDIGILINYNAALNGARAIGYCGELTRLQTKASRLSNLTSEIERADQEQERTLYSNVKIYIPIDSCNRSAHLQKEAGLPNVSGVEYGIMLDFRLLLELNTWALYY